MSLYLAECPHCPNKAKDKPKVKELFGWRTVAKWKKGLKEFPASPTYDERRGCMIVIPKPIVEVLKTPEKFVFKLTGNKVSVSAGVKK